MEELINELNNSISGIENNYSLLLERLTSLSESVPFISNEILEPWKEYKVISHNILDQIQNTEQNQMQRVETFDSMFQPLIEKTKTTENRFDYLKDGLQNVIDTLNELMDSFVEKQTEFVENIDDSTSELTEHIQGMGETINDELTDITENVIKHLEESIEEDAQNLANTVESAVEDNVEQLYQTLITETDEIQNKLQQTSHDVFGDLIANLTEKIKSDINQQLQDLQESAINNLMMEVEAGMLITTVGVTVTSALSPYLPQLQAAKVATEQIKSVLDMLGLD